MGLRRGSLREQVAVGPGLVKSNILYSLRII